MNPKQFSLAINTVDFQSKSYLFIEKNVYLQTCFSVKKLEKTFKSYFNELCLSQFIDDEHAKNSSLKSIHR